MLAPPLTLVRRVHALGAHKLTSYAKIPRTNPRLQLTLTPKTMDQQAPRSPSPPPIGSSSYRTTPNQSKIFSGSFPNTPLRPPPPLPPPHSPPSSPPTSSIPARLSRSVSYNSSVLPLCRPTQVLPSSVRALLVPPPQVTAQSESHTSPTLASFLFG